MSTMYEDVDMENPDVIAEAKALDELKIDMANSNDDWYAVCTVAGIEGFCMKKFIAVRE